MRSFINITNHTSTTTRRNYMDTKSLLIGIICFILGGLLVSVAATTFDKPQTGAEQSVSGARPDYRQ